MATIRKRKTSNGPSYQVQVRVEGQPQRTRSFDRLGDARAWAEETERELKVARAYGQSAAGLTLRDVAERYRATRLQDISASDRDNRDRQIEWWVERFGGCRLSKLPLPAMLAERDSKARQSSNSTANRYWAALSALVGAAVEWRILPSNPCRGVAALKEPPGRVRYLLDAELASFLAECRKSAQPLLYPAVLVSLSTGLRRSELMRLTWSDVDFPSRIIRIVTPTKNRERRGVPLGGEALTALRSIRSGIGDSPVFPGRGKTSDRMSSAFHGAVRRAGIGDFRWHDMRHTAASYLAMAGVPIRTITEILGHKTLSMALRYSHLAASHLAESVELVDRRISRAVPESCQGPADQRGTDGAD